MTDRSRARPGRPSALLLRLYVAGDGPNSVEARTHLGDFLAAHPERDIALEVVDVLADPGQGLRDAIVLTPTLVRIRPLPQQRIIGNLRGRAELLAALVGRGKDNV